MLKTHYSRGRADSPGTMSAVVMIERSIILLLVLGLLVAVAMVLRPFTTAILFGATIAIATWPLREKLIAWGLSPALVATLLLLFSLVLFVLPVVAAAPILVRQVGQGMQTIQTYFAQAPEQPAWLARIPFAGRWLGRLWSEVATASGNLGVALSPYSETIRSMLLSAARAVVDSMVQISLSMLLVTMFWARGSVLIDQIRDVLSRLGGETAEESLKAAGAAVRSVAYGVIGTAIIQALLLTLGLGLVGIPAPLALGFVGLLLAASQVGGPLLIVIWGGGAWWLIEQGQIGRGIFLIGCGLVVSSIDNVLKPWLIGIGVRMPMSLTILGVFGGFATFGFLGLFIGPTLLAVALTLLEIWRRGALTPK